MRPVRSFAGRLGQSCGDREAGLAQQFSDPVGRPEVGLVGHRQPLRRRVVGGEIGQDAAERVVPQVQRGHRAYGEPQIRIGLTLDQADGRLEQVLGEVGPRAQPRPGTQPRLTRFLPSLLAQELVESYALVNQLTD